MSKIRRIVPDMGFVAGRFLLTREGSPWSEANRPVIKGSAFFTLSEWQDLLEVNGPVRLSNELVERVAQELEPRIKATLHGDLRRLGHLTNLELQSPKEERFHRVYRGLHALTRDRVIMHLYDVSAHASAQAEKMASREYRTVQRLQKSPWVPRIMDSFQEIPNYPGELYFFSFADPSAPSLQHRIVDASWGLEERIGFARVACQALQELHGFANDEVRFVHRNITPDTLHVTAAGQPLFTAFHLSRTSGGTTASRDTLLPKDGLNFMAPEIHQSGLAVADQRSDVYALCSTLKLLFTQSADARSQQILAALDLGLAAAPDDRPELLAILEMLSEPAEAVVERPLPSAKYWSEGLLVPFNDHRYRIVSRIGSGSYGTTFKVIEEDPISGDQYGTYVGKVIFDGAAGERALRAYRYTRAQTTEPHLAPILETAREWLENSFVSLMKWVDGRPLQDWIGLVELYSEELGESGPQALMEQWVDDLCQALRSLHVVGLVHGDVSLKNIIESAGNLTLTDFDLALREGERRWSEGTPLYCPPSAVRDQPARASDDVFALAASLFHVAFDREPFRFGGVFRKDAGMNWEGIDRQSWGLVAEFFTRATTINPNERFANAMEALAWLDAARSAAG
ncbi:MAG: protein kinase domain-containing protein [Thermoguttaceae bacterium]